MCLNHPAELVCFDCCARLIAIPRMSRWAYAPREDLAAWNSKRVLSSPPARVPHFPWNFANIRSRSSACGCIKMKSSPPTCRPPPTPTFPPLSNPMIVWLSLEPLLLLWANFFSLIFPAFLSSLCSPPPPLLRGGFRIGGSEMKEKGPVFLSRWKQPGTRQVHGPQAAACDSQAEALTSPSKPRALHLILSCNSHCNCRNPNC